ncbi:hypothetical protein JQC92_12825 [Shewanella sp. 202IG2-18]|uniref:hypothetical protein n=1 Tax=Parashewanella hymeniacidonis TaxID=2807618 RepID=UPI00195F821C|nr:hypothetical protein [Parashewanella hymeniacidonis]MBM7072904.1 hypothetical protein [Parashewanella hymeniacidonis]
MKIKISHLFILVLSVLTSAVSAAEIGRWNQLQFNSNPAVNFHHFIFEMARTEEDIKAQGWKHELTKQEQKNLTTLIAYYKTNFVGKGRSPMRKLPALKDVSKSLTKYKQGSAITLSNKQHLALFNQAFPIYKSNLWKQHDKYNKTWLNALVPKLNKYGSKIQSRLEDKFEMPLFSVKQHPVDIVYRPGHRNGAFTHEWPYTLINSYRDGYKGNASLEMIFHEVAHANAEKKLHQSIRTQFDKIGLKRERDIWHPILFYIVGKTTEDVLADSGIEYSQYASDGIFNRGYFKKFTPDVMTYWKPYLIKNERSLNDTVVEMTNGIAARSKAKKPL